MWKENRRIVGLALAAFLAIGVSSQAVSAVQVLARVGDVDITGDLLESTIASSPVATQFPAMDERLQARIRGDLLRRLINAQLLYLEARQQGLDKSPEYRQQMAAFRQGLLSQAYFERLRQEIVVPSEVDADLKEELKGDGDALAAARSLYVARHYEELRQTRVKELARRYHLTVHEDRIADADQDTVLAEGDGFKLLLSDLQYRGAAEPPKDQALRQVRLEEAVETALVALAAEDQGIEVDAGLMEDFAHRVPAELLLAGKEREWIPDEGVLLDYFQKHPELGLIPEQRQVGQIVVATRQEAESLRQRIIKGESLFELARQYSIDPYGRKKAGDMGFMKAGTAFPALEKAMEGLDDNQVSEVVKTPKGYHLVMITARKPGNQRSFVEIRDRVHQAVLLEHLPKYMADLAQKYTVEVLLPDQVPAATATP